VTDEFADQHNRAVLLKGGSAYAPGAGEAQWYFPQARRLDLHGKYFLYSDGYERSASIGFRCVADADGVRAEEEEGEGGASDAEATMRQEAARAVEQ
jgi:hypothetical protein